VATSNLPLTQISKPDTVRLIPTAYYKPPILGALVDDAQELEILAGIEGLTNQRLKAQTSGLPGLDPRELVYGIWGTTYINAAFAYTRTGGNRFNDEMHGAWYCAFDGSTALAEVAYHRTRELSYIDSYKDEAVYHALLAGFIGEFHDARKLGSNTDYLDPDPKIAYGPGQALAHKLRAQGARGIIYPSARKKSGTCLVAFHPHLVQNVRTGLRWKISWDGSPDYVVSID